ncbi:hypothetical protein Efla_005183 [Eimeria flavescens]
MMARSRFQQPASSGPASIGATPRRSLTRLAAFPLLWESLSATPWPHWMLRASRNGDRAAGAAQFSWFARHRAAGDSAATTLEIAEEEHPKTSFFTPDCQRQYRCLPYNFASRPAIAEHVADMVLGGMNSEYVFVHADFTKALLVDSDGSGDGLGAVLLPHYADSAQRVIAYVSRSLPVHEEKWTATESEAAALT